MKKQFAMLVKVIEEGVAGTLSGSFTTIDFADADTFEEAVNEVDEVDARLGYKVLEAELLAELPLGYINEKTYEELFALAEQKMNEKGE